MVTTWGKKYHFEKRGGGGEYDFLGKYIPPFFLMDWGI